MDSEHPVNLIDRSSFRVIYDLYFEPVCRFLNYYTRDLSAIEDVVQEVFVKLWEDREFLEIRHIKTYLYSAARNRMLNYLRNEENQSVLLQQWSKEKAETNHSKDCYDLDEFTGLVNRAINELPEKCRIIFTQSKWGKLSYKQIAELHHISVKTVETQMSIALKRIREYISAHYEVTMTTGILLFSFLEK